MKPTRQIIAKNPRMAWALLGSALIHAALIFSLSLKTWQARQVDAGGFQAPLAARIAGAQKSDVPAETGLVSKPRVVRRAPEQPDRSAIILAVPGLEAAASDPEAASPPVAVPEGGGGTAVHPGISVTETLFQRALPPEFRKVLIDTYPDFIRSAEINQAPQPVNLVMPEYPAGELATKTYTWIVIAIFVDEQGQVVAAVPVTGAEGFEDFQEQVVAAMQDSTFTPGQRFGVPVKSISFQMVEFRPHEDAASNPQPQAPAAAGGGPN